MTEDDRDRFIERLEDDARQMHEDEHEWLDPDCIYCADEMAERAAAAVGRPAI